MHELTGFLETLNSASTEISSDSPVKTPSSNNPVGEEFHNLFNKIAQSTPSDGAEPAESTILSESEQANDFSGQMPTVVSGSALRSQPGKSLPQLTLHQRALAAGRIVLTTAESKVSDVSMAAFMGQQVMAKSGVPGGSAAAVEGSDLLDSLQARDQSAKLQVDDDAKKISRSPPQAEVESLTLPIETKISSEFEGYTSPSKPALTDPGLNQNPLGTGTGGDKRVDALLDYTSALMSRRRELVAKTTPNEKASSDLNVVRHVPLTNPEMVADSSPQAKDKSSHRPAQPAPYGNAGFERLSGEISANSEKAADSSFKKDEGFIGALVDQSKKSVKLSQNKLNERDLWTKSIVSEVVREPSRGDSQTAQVGSLFSLRDSGSRVKDSGSAFGMERSSFSADIVSEFKAEFRTVLRSMQTSPDSFGGDPNRNYEVWSERLAQSVASRMQAMIASNNWQLSMRLDPASLGEIRVDLQMTETGIEGRLSATDEVTRQLLQDGLQKLKIAMRDVLEPGQDLNLSVKKDGGSDAQKNDEQEKNSEITDELDIIGEVASEFAVSQEPGSGILDILV